LDLDDDDLDEDSARISPDAWLFLPISLDCRISSALSPNLVGSLDLAGPFSKSRRIAGSRRPFLQMSLGLAGKKKKKKI
jgi:hypothetical protein